MGAPWGFSDPGAILTVFPAPWGFFDLGTILTVCSLRHPKAPASKAYQTEGQGSDTQTENLFFSALQNSVLAEESWKDLGG